MTGASFFVSFFQGLVPPAALVAFALGSILFGWATPTQGAACGALILTLVYGQMTPSRFYEALIKTLEITVLILAFPQIALWLPTYIYGG